MSIEFTHLPYAEDALEPHVSARTLEYHYGKHHKAYVDKLNAAIEGTDYDGLSLEEIVHRSLAEAKGGIFNNAAQVWNHEFLWQSMTASGTEPSAPLAEAINKAFGDMAGFREAFKAAAMGQFGSGWAWLVAVGDSVEIRTTGNAGTPLTDDVVPLLTLDVWEHAYYLDFQNERNRYIDAFLDNLINWDFAARNFSAEKQAA